MHCTKTFHPNFKIILWEFLTITSYSAIRNCSTNNNLFFRIYKQCTAQQCNNARKVRYTIIHKLVKWLWTLQRPQGKLMDKQNVKQYLLRKRKCTVARLSLFMSYFISPCIQEVWLTIYYMFKLQCSVCIVHI